MKINRKELLTALEKVKPGIGKSDRIGQFNSFAFMEDHIVTYNDEISISHPLENSGMEGAINAEEMYKILKKLKADELELDVVKNEVQLVCGKMKAGMALHEEIDLPLEEIKTEGRWRRLPDNFVELLGFAVLACAQDMVRPLLACVHFNKGVIQGTDGLKVAQCELSKALPTDPFLIPATSVKQVMRLKPTKIHGGEGWAHFKNEEGTVISCRTFEDDYLPLDGYLDVDGIDVIFPEDMLEVLDRASVFAHRDSVLDEQVSLKITKNKIVVKGRSETGWFEEAMKIDYTGDPVKINIAPYALADILKTNSGRECIIGENSVKFEGPGWQYVTVLQEEQNKSDDLPY